MAIPLVVYANDLDTQGGRWFEWEYAGVIRWEFFDASPQGWIEKHWRRPGLPRTRSCWQAVHMALRDRARLLITCGPGATLRCSSFLRMRGARVPLLAWGFNFASLPTGIKRRLMAQAFAHVDRFMVFSTIERQLYSDYFDVPVDRFEMIHWGVGRPEVAQPQTPIETGDYICAVGGNARDYRTLIEAMARLPQVPLVAVVRPENLAGLSVPPNVKVRVNAPVGEANHIIQHSRFMVLPLRDSDVPCGVVTLVSAMHLGVANLVTRSSGLDDYIEPGVNGLTYEARSAADLADQISRLWEDRRFCQALAQNGQNFAALHCSEQQIRDRLRVHLARYGLLPDRPVEASNRSH
jgi:glycosyltransferase involved in cell wall biosynthesis